MNTMADDPLSSQSSTLMRLKDKKKMMFRDVKYSMLAGDAEDDDDNSMTLASRRQNSDENILTRTLQPGDSLQSISLQYYVPVAELKRLNNILRDNEIHARTTLKIPLRPITSLVDLSTPSQSAVTQEESELVKLRIGSGCNPTEFLAAMDRDLAKIRANVPQVHLSTEMTFNASPPPPSNLINSCSGSDWGLRWQPILLFSLIFTLSLPFIIWYNKHHIEEAAAEVSKLPS